MQNFVFENNYLRLTLGSDGYAKSLFAKVTNEELIPKDSSLPAFSATQNRPYNNEIKLAYMNKETTFESSGIRLDESGRLLVKFGLFPFEAIINVGIQNEYITFTLDGFSADAKDYPPPMDFPPVTRLELIRLPFDSSLTYGAWMNVVHTEKSCTAVMAASPHAYINEKCIFGRRIISAEARKGIKLISCTAALISAPKKDFLDAVDRFEHDFKLPLGVQSRRSKDINSSIYWTTDICPANVDKHIKYAKAGGFEHMLIYYSAICKTEGSYGGYERCGDYEFNKNYPNGESDLLLVIDKLKDSGITPGIHFLHTHIGVESEYVTPKADRRLHLLKKFTLSRPLSTESDTVYVDESPLGMPIDTEKCRLLRFDGEIISYDGYSSTFPYCFTGCKRGHFKTDITEHKAFTIGGVLDVCEFGGTSIYIDQDSDLQEEIGDKLAKIYNYGFEFVYFDGSEGTNAPFDYHIPNAQYRVYKKLAKTPLFCEGAAKAHFGWHMLSGGNAFDVFDTPIFKEMIIAHPFTEAEFMQKDFTRINFGWWMLKSTTRVDVYEFGTSKAAAYDCPETIMVSENTCEGIPRIDDILEMLRRWEDVRKIGRLTEEDKKMLRDPRTEFTLLRDKNGKYLILPYYEAVVANPDAEDSVIGGPKDIKKEQERKCSIRAFVFEHEKDSFAVIWDDLGESTLELSGINIKAYTKELETKALPFTVSGCVSKFNVSSRAYIRTDADMHTLASALKNGLWKHT